MLAEKRNYRITSSMTIKTFTKISAKRIQQHVNTTMCCHRDRAIGRKTGSTKGSIHANRLKKNQQTVSMGMETQFDGSSHLFMMKIQKTSKKVDFSLFGRELQ